MFFKRSQSTQNPNTTSTTELEKITKIREQAQLLSQYWIPWQKLADILLHNNRLPSIEESLNSGNNLSKEDINRLISKGKWEIIIKNHDKCGYTIEQIYKMLYEMDEKWAIMEYFEYFSFLKKDEILELMDHCENSEKFIDKFDEINWLNNDEKTEIIIRVGKIMYALKTIKNLNHKKILDAIYKYKENDENNTTYYLNYENHKQEYDEIMHDFHHEIENEVFNHIINNAESYDNNTARYLLDCWFEEDFLNIINKFQNLDWSTFKDLINAIKQNCHINGASWLKQITDNLDAFKGLGYEHAEILIKLWYPDIVLKYPGKFGLKIGK